MYSDSDSASSDSSVNLSDYGDELPPDIVEACKEVALDSLPEKSKKQYIQAYNEFKSWRKEKKTQLFVESVFVAYFKEIDKKYAPPTLWAKFSMIKTCCKALDNIDISNYHIVIAFIKKKNRRYKKKKAKIFTPAEIRKFLCKAPNDIYLCKKVALIFGIYGACRRSELANLRPDQIIDRSTSLEVNLEETKNEVDRTFIVKGQCYDLCKKYISLRPDNASNDRFFVYYNNNKCTRQPIGINTMGKVTIEVATWLKLENPKLYTSHSFRRTSATFLADGGGNENELMRHGGWKSGTTARGYVDKSEHNRQETNTKITKVIDLNASKSSSNLHKKSIDFQIPSTSKEKTLLAQQQLSNITNLEKETYADFDQNLFDDVHLSRPTSTQAATCGSPQPKKQRKNYEQENLNPLELLQQDKNVSFNIHNCNVTINIHYNNEK